MARRSSSGRTQTKAKKRKKKKRKPQLSARTADRYDLYQRSVQGADFELEFIHRIFKKHNGKRPHHLREDFCGTALISAAWADQGKGYTAEAYDIDPEPLAWGKKHNLAPRGDGVLKRCRLLEKDVRKPSRKRPEVRLAQNFSYRVFKERPVLLDYFKRVRKDLVDGGVFILDTHGGPESLMEMEEPREVEPGFTYVWDQAEYWPGTGDYTCHIHFRFPDGTKLKKAFTYEWRFWHLTELLDLLRDAGFREADGYWEGTAEDGESGNGVYRRSKKGENCLSWVTYVVAVK
jgi:hypothetical protein